MFLKNEIGLTAIVLSMFFWVSAAQAQTAIKLDNQSKPSQRSRSAAKKSSAYKGLVAPTNTKVSRRGRAKQKPQTEGYQGVAAWEKKNKKRGERSVEGFSHKQKEKTMSKEEIHKKRIADYRKRREAEQERIRLEKAGVEKQKKRPSINLSIR